MKILHLITSLKVGGAESALVNLLSKIVNRDENEHIVAYFHSGLNVKKIEDLGVKCVRFSGIFSTYDPILFLRLLRFVKTFKPDLIHSSLWSANILARLIAKICKIPVVCDLHGNSFDEGKFRNWFDRKTVQLCGKIIAVSDSVKDSYLKNITDQQDKVVVIKNGIDFELIRNKALINPLIRKDFGILDSDFVIGAVGRLEPIKSYDILIKAFSEFLKIGDVGKSKLIIVGDGSQRAYLEGLVKRLNLEENVIFVGFRSDSYKFYQLFNCFALSSHSEGLSIALLEAMTFELPVITTHYDLERHDVIKPGINGFLVSPGNINEYVLAINTLYQNSEQAKIIGARNLTLIKSEFSIEGVVSGYQEVYNELLSKKL